MKLSLANLQERCEKSFRELDEKTLRLETDELQLLHQIWSDLRLRVDVKLGVEAQDIILGALQAAITPLAESVTRKMVNLEVRVDTLTSSDSDRTVVLQSSHARDKYPSCAFVLFLVACIALACGACLHLLYGFCAVLSFIIVSFCCAGVSSAGTTRIAKVMGHFVAGLSCRRPHRLLFKVLRE